MRESSVPKVAKSVIRVAGAVFLASAAAGCSSDVSRFAGGRLFNDTDNMTTSSISRGGNEITGLNGDVPVPRASVGAGGYVASNQVQPSNVAAAPSYPVQRNTVYGNVAPSSARSVSRPMAVERASLSAPSAAKPIIERDPVSRNEAMAQPFPANMPQTRSADPLVTGAVKSKLSSGWTTANAPQVTLKNGESITTLSSRYGVPEKEILAANGLSSAKSAKPGQTVTIPMFSASANAARAAATTGALPNRENAPQLPDAPTQKVAVLPTTPQLRDKAQTATTASTAKATPGQGKPGAAGAYVVKPGDSLAKIARETGTPVAQLKAANNITNESIRVGQTLKLPNGAAAPATDNLKTASIPPKQAAAPAAAPQVQPATAQKPAAAAQTASASAKQQPAASAPQPYKPPVASNESVTEAEKKSDVTAAAPSSTGIGKYRWPVQGAVTSRFGDNVEGKRSDGINISVPEGTPVKAAENGVVIYAGNGLKELGNTVLIRHDDGKVTVYGNAAGLNVQRGQKVQRGQTIASSGMTGNASRPQLHFEVRKDATPVNPSSFLE